MLFTSKMGQVEGIDRAEILGQNSMFRSLSPEELARIASLTTTETVPPGNVIFKQGDPGDILYVIVSGAARVFFTNEENAEVAVARLGPGDAVGEMAIFTGDPRSASIQLRTQAEKAAASDQPLLITGEHGTEKLKVAQMVHEKSERAKKAFLCLDCGDVPAVVPQEAAGEAGGFLLEMAQSSALFGYRRGAFSFARSSWLGYLSLGFFRNRGNSV